VTSHLPEAVRRLREQFQAQAQEFKQVSAEFGQQLAKARQDYPPLTKDQRAQLEAHYRSGKAGKDLQELQAMVDRGQVTWDAIESGKADPELTEKYYGAMGQAKTYLQAAVEGRDINEFLPKSDRPDDDDDGDDFSERNWVR
jgi:hypothetical protein